MFEADFYPTPSSVIDKMIEGFDLNGKTVLEPSSGKGNIIERCKQAGANIICCEQNKDLAVISASKAHLVANNFFTINASQVSHIDFIIMNPPFSDGVNHILHAWKIAPDNCKIVSLCNSETINNAFSKSRKELSTLIKNYGHSEYLGTCFDNAERKTGVEVAMISLTKPDQKESTFDYSEYFTSDDDEVETQENAIMQYSAIREIVQRYVNAVKLYDTVIETAIKMNDLTAGIDTEKFAFTLRKEDAEMNREQFAKELQKKSWEWIIKKLNMQKYSTIGLEKKINAFVEQQKELKFTMKNVYRMLDMIMQTRGQLMDEALIEIFDRLTKYYDENRWGMEGWKTNSHFLINKKFILPYIVHPGWNGVIETDCYNRNGNGQLLQDFLKAICFLTGYDSDSILSLNQMVRYRYKIKQDERYLSNYQNQDNDIAVLEKRQSEFSFQTEIEDSKVEWGKWFDWAFFRVKLYKKGTGHFIFKDESVWALVNRNVARIKGYPLPENIRA